MSEQEDEKLCAEPEWGVAVRRGLLNFYFAIARLRQTNFRLSSTIFKALAPR